MAETEPSTLRTRPPFAITPEWLLDSGVSDRAIRLYAVLDRYANDRTARCWPGRATLAERLSCSESAVDRAIAELRDAGALNVKRRGLTKTNLYTVLLWPPGESSPETTQPNGDSSTQPTLETAEPTTPIGNESQKNESQKTRALEKAAATDADLIVLALSKHLTALAVKHTITARWYDEARLMVESDGREVARVLEVLAWIFEGSGSWWQPNIHSTAKLRKQYDTLRMQLSRDRNYSRPAALDVIEADIRRLRDQGIA